MDSYSQWEESQEKGRRWSRGCCKFTKRASYIGSRKSTSVQLVKLSRKLTNCAKLRL